MATRLSRSGWLLAAGSLSLMAACGEGAVSGRPGPDASGAAGAAVAGGGGAGTGGGAGAGQGGAGTGAAGTSGAAGTTGAAGTGALAGADGGAEAGAGTGAAGTGDAGTPEAGTPPAPRDDALKARAAAAMVPLQAWYNMPTGLWQMNDWWTSANQLEAVIDYTRETGDTKYLPDVENTYVKNQASNFDRYGFYDDDGWWAITWIKAYDLTKQQKYLDMAKTIFKRMSGGWDTKCGGGIYWASAKNSQDGLKNKNAIPNSLFMQVAAKLHLRTPGDTGAGSYLDWAQREWTWFKGTGMLTAKHQVIDSLDGLTTCKPTGPIFTYNNGVLLGALVDLAAGTGEATLLDEAGAITRATMSMMTDGKGTLKETPCGGDICTQFKGVFMRNLLLLFQTKPAADLQAYARHQSDAIWTTSRNATDQLGYEWHLPFDKATASRQSSALDALTAAYASSAALP
jgi:predicted alpha-1,6-mannanase (GH76 family)